MTFNPGKSAIDSENAPVASMSAVRPLMVTSFACSPVPERSRTVDTVLCSIGCTVNRDPKIRLRPWYKPKETSTIRNANPPPIVNNFFKSSRIFSCLSPRKRHVHYLIFLGRILPVDYSLSTSCLIHVNH